MATTAQRTLQRADKFTRLGQFDLAEVEYETLLSRYPASKRAKAGLKNLQALNSTPNHATKTELDRITALLVRGDAAQANRDALDLLNNHLNDPRLCHLTGITFAECHRPKDAIAHYLRALDIDPENADIAYNLGNAYRDLGDHPSALEAYGKVIQIQPNFPTAYNNIGVSLAELGHHDGAITAYEQAIKLSPNMPNPHRNLGKEYYNSGDFIRAITHTRRALELDPDNADTAVALANAYYFAGRMDDTIDMLERAIALQPDFPVALNNLGAVLRRVGRREDAIDCFTRALALKPDYAEAHFSLTTLKHYKSGDPQIAAMHALEADKSLSQTQQTYLNFALAKALRDLDEHDRSYTFLERGNDLHRLRSGYDIRVDNALFANLRNAFTPTSPTLALPPRTGPTPVFIVGMPRSGTTLADQILASHSDVHGAGELEYLARSLREGSWKSGPPTKGHLQEIRQSYFSQLDNISCDTRFITDKMPNNFRLIGFILSALPEAKIIHVKRDARATCWSIYSHLFSDSSCGFAYNQHEVATYYRMYLDMMTFWHARFPGRIYDLSYEALTENQLVETRKLLDHVGLGWQDQCLDFQNTKRAVTAASTDQVRQKIYQGSSEKWRQFTGHLGPMIDILQDC